ncbi:hypothetical protein DCAR_0208233 [Daucus carota subsp. sativus]|uniref:Uncharacterized protein n=1 Tax=Daucus carota subsp. sativus TaxID=79200 RepID=A0A166EEI5_DAUCS|nr:hypothetical protein DCAR_0208233 [Daucus carota subsp. sativus]
MTSYSKQITFAFLISIILSYQTTVTSQVCPEPCRFSPPAILTPGPPAGSNNPRSPSNLTNAPPAIPVPGPPAGSNSPPDLTNAPSPPDGMVPWFPYYYRRPLPGSDQSSSPSAHISGWTALIICTSYLLVFA